MGIAHAKALTVAPVSPCFTSPKALRAAIPRRLDSQDRMACLAASTLGALGRPAGLVCGRVTLPCGESRGGDLGVWSRLSPS